LANNEDTELNGRQRLCLQIAAALDTENERYYRDAWHLQAPPGVKPPSEDSWRWLQYDPSHSQLDPPLRRRLREAGMDGRGIKRTFDALFTRGYIRVRQQQLGKYRVSWLRLTPAGRRAARQVDPQREAGDN
jgi:DNA-binding MarR family transcriptional regulator